MTVRGDFEHGFRRLYDEQSPSLFRYLDRLTGDPDLAADLTQEAFVRLYQRGAVPDDVRAWLGAVATNLFRDERRRFARRERLLAKEPEENIVGAPPPMADNEAIAEEQRVMVRQALDRLPERDRQMLLLRHEGYSYRELSKALAIRETSVGTLLARATTAFRASFTERHHAP